MTSPFPPSWTTRLIEFLVAKKLIVVIFVILIVLGGVLVSPFDWHFAESLRNPVPVDAIPDIGENQQIVFTEWPGRSPQDVEDQISYPLTVALLGLPEVKTIRSFSMFGFSSIYVIFDDSADFYWCRSRVLEKLNSLSTGVLPEGAQPRIGPDATAMGQVFWYTLEGMDRQGHFAGNWDLNELRTIQDWYVRFALQSVPGVSEVASVGGFVQEYQVDMDPDLMRINKVTLNELVTAIKRANQDVGAQTLEVNRVEYVVRGIGFIQNLEDLKNAYIKFNGDVPVFVRNVAHVSLGPAPRRGLLDKGGNEAVGGVVVVRYGANPLDVIQKVKMKIKEIGPALPKRELADGRTSQVTIVPFYDRTQLIHETLDTLQVSLANEILVTIIVVVLMVFHLGSALLIAGILPLAVLICFIAMKLFGVDANIVALSGIAIAIGTLVDMGIIIIENILRHLSQHRDDGDASLTATLKGTREVGGAVLTAVSTTIISFLPVFMMEGAEGKLFRPLAFTKTFALLASLLLALTVLPPLAHLLHRKRQQTGSRNWMVNEGLVYAGILIGFLVNWEIGLLIALVGGFRIAERWIPPQWRNKAARIGGVGFAVAIGWLLATHWMPLGAEKGPLRNFLFVALTVGSLLGAFHLFQRFYEKILKWCLDHKAAFLSLPLLSLLIAALVWQGYPRVLGWTPHLLQGTAPMQWLARSFPGLGKEFMPPLDEGSYLYMPSTMPHASISEGLDIIRKQDLAIQAIPEVESVVGKLGRADTPLDPAPLSMIETLVNYKPKYLQGNDGEPTFFRFDADRVDLARAPDGSPLPAADGKPYRVVGAYDRDDRQQLIPDPHGRPFRLWRPPLDPKLNPGREAWAGIRRPEDIWECIVRAAHIPGTTSAAELQPISARMVMLQSGIRARMGIKVFGPDLETIQASSIQIEKLLRELPSIDPQTVIADRVVGKPYLEIHIDRLAAAQYGIDLQRVLDVIEYAIGGKRVTTTVEGRERYTVRVRYMRELRDNLLALGSILVPAPDGTKIPLRQMAKIVYVHGPQVIKGEDTFLVGYVLFDPKPGYAPASVAEGIRRYLQQKIDTGGLRLPDGVAYSFAGTYENQTRAEKRLEVILPLALLLIFVILYLQFSSPMTCLLVYSGIAVSWAGGFIMIWLYSQPWFLDFSILGTSMRDLFQVHPIHLSVAIWVGFLALFGIASDDGVVMATYLDNRFKSGPMESRQEVRQATIEASLQRLRPCLTTTATTLLALIPVLTSTGRGSDIMIPMAIPSFGGMTLEVMTMLVVPVLYCWAKERRIT